MMQFLGQFLQMFQTVGGPVAIAILLMYKLIKRFVMVLRLPPGPWRIGFSLRCAYLPVMVELETLARTYGSLMCVRFGFTRKIVISSGNLAETVMIDGFRDFHLREDLRPHWRSLADFHAPLLTERRAHFDQSMKEELRFTLAEISRESNGTDAIRMDQKIDSLVLNIFTMVMWSKRLPEEQFQAAKIVTGISSRISGQEQVSFLTRWTLWYSTNKLKRYIGSLLKEHRGNALVARETADNEVAAVVDTFMDFVLTREEPQINDKHRSSFFLDLVIQCSRISEELKWAMVELVKNPEILQRVQEELNEHVGPDRFVEESDLPRLQLLSAVVHEVLRLHPASPFISLGVANKDIMFRGYFFPKGTQVLVNVHGVQRDPAVWDLPARFDPDRFMNGTINLIDENSTEMFPFGAGKVLCPGRDLSVTMISCLLANFLHLFNWDLPTVEEGGSGNETLLATPKPMSGVHDV